MFVLLRIGNQGESGVDMEEPKKILDKALSEGHITQEQYNIHQALALELCTAIEAGDEEKVRCIHQRMKDILSAAGACAN